MKTKELQWVTLRDKSGRASSLGIYGKKHSDTLIVTGNLEHGAHVAPDSIQDADRLIDWLQDWKESQATGKAVQP